MTESEHVSLCQPERGCKLIIVEQGSPQSKCVLPGVMYSPSLTFTKKLLT